MELSDVIVFVFISVPTAVFAALLFVAHLLVEVLNVISQLVQLLALVVLKYVVKPALTAAAPCRRWLDRSWWVMLFVCARMLASCIAVCVSILRWIECKVHACKSRLESVNIPAPCPRCKAIRFLHMHRSMGMACMQCLDDAGHLCELYHTDAYACAVMRMCTFTGLLDDIPMVVRGFARIESLWCERCNDIATLECERNPLHITRTISDAELNFRNTIAEIFRRLMFECSTGRLLSKDMRAGTWILQMYANRDDGHQQRLEALFEKVERIRHDHWDELEYIGQPLLDMMNYDNVKQCRGLMRQARARRANLAQFKDMIEQVRSRMMYERTRESAGSTSGGDNVCYSDDWYEEEYSGSRNW